MNIKKILMLGVVLMFAGMAAYAQSDITGKWNTVYSSPEGDFPLVLNFKVNGGVVTGTIGSEMGELPLDHGKVEGKKFTYDFVFQDMLIKHAGELISKDEILIKSEMGELKLTRAKE
ncbi:hypothetical protein [Algoriphagus sp.]|uniref:hypothetical protein n=1 Tax=Algoriphagus sp. TaxID=1872435 RepID=UPI003270EAF0